MLGVRPYLSSHLFHIYPTNRVNSKISDQTKWLKTILNICKITEGQITADGPRDVLCINAAATKALNL